MALGLIQGVEHALNEKVESVEMNDRTVSPDNMINVETVV